MTAQGLWQPHYHILSIIFLKESIELNVNLDMIIKKCETCGIRYKCCDCFFEYANFNDDLIGYRCLICNKNCQKKFEEKFDNFSIHANFLTMITISFLLLQKGVCPCEYKDDWDKFNKKNHYLKKIFTVT